MPDGEKMKAIETMATEYRQDYPEVKELTVPALIERMEKENVLLIDVREESEQRVSTIPGAITFSTFEKEKQHYKDRVIVTYCTIGLRSGLCAEELQEEGSDVYNLRGSILAWAHAGQPVVDAEGLETKRVHVYGEKWNLLPEEYTPVW